MIKSTIIFENINSLLGDSSKINHLFLQSLSKINLLSVYQDSRCKYPRDSIIKLMILLKVLQAPSINALMHSQWASILQMGKDVFYKVKNSTTINWRKLLLSQAIQSNKEIEIDKDSNQVSEISCFIIDDSDIEKKGKCIEWIGRIFSHVNHNYKLGFKSLNLAYWSGKHLTHIDFSYHIELGKKKNQGMKSKDLKNRFSKDRAPNSPSAKRVAELVKKKTSCAISMIRRAMAGGLEASYILADSWFFNSELAQFTKSKKIHLISRPKFNNWKYTQNGRSYTIGKLILKMRRNKKVKWNRHLRKRFVKVGVQFKGMNLSVMYYNERKRGGRWQAIITTDNKLTAQKAYEIYQSRWAIENSYKELKQHLNYGKSMSRDFDGQISDATQSLMVYNTLSHLKAVEQHQSIGYLFKTISQQWLKPTMMQKFWKEFFKAIQEIADTLNKTVEELIYLIINKSEFFKQLNKLNAILTTET